MQGIFAIAYGTKTMTHSALAIQSGIKHFPGMLTGEQIRAARAMLKWSARELAERSGVSWDTVQRMDSAEGPVPGRHVNVDRVMKTLEAAGAIFLEDGEMVQGGPGVRFRKI